MRLYAELGYRKHIRSWDAKHCNKFLVGEEGEAGGSSQALLSTARSRWVGAWSGGAVGSMGKISSRLAWSA